jgi:chemotaxis response regulator CheB
LQQLNSVLNVVPIFWDKHGTPRARFFTMHKKKFPVVCLGGADGDIKTYTSLVRLLTNDMGVAVVIVNYLEDMADKLLKTLPQCTTMPVELINERLLIETNHIFIIPKKLDLHVTDGEFRFEAASKPAGWPNVITVFLNSLAQNWDGQLIAVILSGFDGDGSNALCGIKAVGGITIAQKAENAARPDMPNSAIASGCIDTILAPEDIAKEIVRIAHDENAQNS